MSGLFSSFSADPCPAGVIADPPGPVQRPASPRSGSDRAAGSGAARGGDRPARTASLGHRPAGGAETHIVRSGKRSRFVRSRETPARSPTGR